MSHPARTIVLNQPPAVHIGLGAAAEVGKWAELRGFKTSFVITSPSMRALVHKLGLPGEVTVYSEISNEPDLSRMANLSDTIRAVCPELVVGFGGGSVLDAAKIAALLAGNLLGVTEVIGIDRVASRSCALAQVPTTAGTGSEAGMRALVCDPVSSVKLMVQATAMLADVVAIDPALMVSLPPPITASTGIDALAHCVEAYTSKLAHPLIDLYAVAGIQLIGRWLPIAVADGSNLQARTALGTAALYGGFCLGPVNTTAGHAVAYPLGTRHHVPHGLANAIIFPHVLAFNAPAVPEKTAAVVEALGFPRSSNPAEVLSAAYHFAQKVGLDLQISAAGVPTTDFLAMATAAHGIRRLLDNNPRSMEITDIEAIYRAADQIP